MTTGVTFRSSFRCAGCGAESKLVCHARPRSFEEMIPTGWKIAGSEATCLDCQRGRTLDATAPRPSAVADSAVVA